MSMRWSAGRSGKPSAGAEEAALLWDGVNAGSQHRHDERREAEDRAGPEEGPRQPPVGLDVHRLGKSLIEQLRLFLVLKLYIESSSRLVDWNRYKSYWLDLVAVEP
jgi:hypothetical protein